MTAEIRWHGHANFQIISGGVSVLFDPFFTGNPACSISWRQAPPADLVLITHDHGDHVGDAVEICRSTGALCCAMYETAFSLVDRGLPPERIGAAPNVGGTAQAGGVSITLTPALHSSETGAPVGYVVRLPDGFTVYHSGDTALYGDMALIGDDHDIDLALLAMGGYYTMDARQAVRAASLIRPKTVVPMHWGTFPPLAQSPDEFTAIMAETLPDVRVVAMRPGESLRL